MSDKVELIAAAQVTVVSGSPGSISFASNHGFETASRGSPGEYELILEHKHDAPKLVINVTRDNTTSGEIAAAPLGSGDVKSIQISCFDVAGAAADSSFFITVHRVRS
jgi:hypothetical protein